MTREVICTGQRVGPRDRHQACGQGNRPLIIVLAFVLVAAGVTQPLKPAVHGDFDHYTFALTWQPGICSTDGGCLPNQARSSLIGLHGLWASRPRELIERGITDPQWWSRGCDYYVHSSAAPALGASLRSRLDAVMPHFKRSLLTHEYDKHVQCFGFDPTRFFSTELEMREAVVRSAFGKYLAAQSGLGVTHESLIVHFDAAFSTHASASLQLQCERDAAGRIVLTQLWITVKAQKIGAFPASPSLVNAPTNQDTCPKEFLIPRWPG